MMRHVPNALTLFRLACLPFFFWIYGWQAPGFAWKATLLMWFAGWSDVLDGYIARRYNATTPFGQMLDPLVDRVFFLTVLAAYVYYGTMPWWSAAPVIARDVILALGAAVLVGLRGERPRVMQVGRLANFVLAWGLAFFMLGVRFLAWPIYALGAAMYIVTGGLYCARFIRESRAGRQSADGPPAVS